VLFKASGPVSTSGYIIVFLLIALAGMYGYQHYTVELANSKVTETKAVSQVDLILRRAREAESKLETAEDANTNLKGVIELRDKLDEVKRETTQLQKIEVKKTTAHTEALKKTLPIVSKTTLSIAEADKASLMRINAIWDAYCYPTQPGVNCTEQEQ